MFTAKKPDLLYAMDALEAIESVKVQIGTALRQLATEQAVRDGRILVTYEDVIRTLHHLHAEVFKLATERPAGVSSRA